MDFDDNEQMCKKEQTCLARIGAMIGTVVLPCICLGIFLMRKKPIDQAILINEVFNHVNVGMRTAICFFVEFNGQGQTRLPHFLS